ncbi:MAG: type II toxin-antitoxin system Phd/YefM family antitoxin [Egibacteraceae bacterium]
MSEVGAADLRRNLRHWLKRAREGETVVVTERGLPVARLTGIDEADLIERLTAEGLLSMPQSPRRPRAAETPKIRPRDGDVSSFVVEERDRKR